MAGNSRRQGAVRKSKKGAQVGSGRPAAARAAGQGADPDGRGPQGASGGAPARLPRPRARQGTPGHGARSDERTRRSCWSAATRSPRRCGRRCPATALYVAIGIEADERVTEAVRIAGNRGISLLEVSRAELDRRTGGLLHQGIALQVPPFRYRELPDLLGRRGRGDGAAAAGRARRGHRPAQPRGGDPVGGRVRRARRDRAGAALGRGDGGGLAHVGRHGGAPPGRAGDQPGARAARLPSRPGCSSSVSTPTATTSLDDLEWPTDPLVVVVGSEGRGLSRLVGETCDLTVSIPMAGPAESLNASVAAAVTLAEIARRAPRRLTRPAPSSCRSCSTCGR